MRRIQNRGYGTLARMAAHLDRLAVGDEANAAIDAFDAVNLMTVHAAKGLEFPVVFVVNLARGSGGPREPVRLANGAGGDGSVAIGDFQSDADTDYLAREREETKRLMYVALTRARDRLYLGTVLKDAQMQPGRGSLGEILPRSLIERFAAVDGTTEWQASSGSVHYFRMCTPSDRADAGGFVTPAGAVPRAIVPVRDDFGPLRDSVRGARTVASAVADVIGDNAVGVGDGEAQSDRLVGTLVHRLLERLGFDAATDRVRETALQLIRPEEDVLDAAEFTPAELADRAQRSYRAICGHPEVRSLYQSRDRWHEVPFIMRFDGRAVRGTIDCLVQATPGTMTLLEFKTGRRRPEHEVQLGFYHEAAARLFPGMTIEAKIVYSDEACVL